MFAIRMNSLQKYSLLSFFALFSLIIFSCNNYQTAKKELSEPVFRGILVDAFMSEAYIADASATKNFNASQLMNSEVYTIILKKYGVDTAQFAHTFDYYLQHPDDFRTLLSVVQDTLNAIAQKAPLAESELAPLPSAPVIQSDSALEQDAMKRLEMMKNRQKLKNKGSQKPD
jgi:hypothetical protein